MINRLVSLGNVIIDIVAEVPTLPERSGDVLASGVALEVGGSFNLMAAAARQGLDVGTLGRSGMVCLVISAVGSSGPRALPCCFPMPQASNETPASILCWWNRVASVPL
jgi:hypothetical protein